MPPVKPTKTFERQPHFRVRAPLTVQTLLSSGPETHPRYSTCRLQKRVFVGQSALRERPERKGLGIAQPGAAAERIVDPNQQVPQLV